VLTTGCNPASAAPIVSPQNPDSVMGLSMTRLSPNLSNRPFVTLYLDDGEQPEKPSGLHSG
jgi:hypothetical protein